eukprot:3042572-Pyramimonas_sp.AAC.2
MERLYQSSGFSQRWKRFVSLQALPAMRGSSMGMRYYLVTLVLQVYTRGYTGAPACLRMFEASCWTLRQRQRG